MDLSEFHEAAEAVKKPHGVDRFLNELPDDKRETLLAALADPRITGAAITRVAERWGTELGIKAPGQSTVQKFRHQYRD